MRHPILLAALVLVTTAGAGEEPAPLAVSIAGLQLAGPAGGPGTGMDRLRPFNEDEGTTVALLVRSAGGNLVTFDEDASKLTRVIDSTGGDLVKPRSGSGQGDWGNRARFGPFPKIADDGSAALIEISVPQVPAAGATAIDLDVTLAFRCGRGEVTVTSPGVDLKTVGTKFTAGKLTFTVAESDSSGDDELPLAIGISTSDNLDQVKRTVFRSGGQELKCRQTGTSRWGMNNAVTTTVNYQLAAPPGPVEVVLICHQEVFPVSVPLQTKVGLGLAPAR